MSLTLDAIIIPAGRPSRPLPADALELASETGAQLYLMGAQSGPQLPSLPGTELRRGNDLAWRRKEGLRCAAQNGARTALLHDDDIDGLTPEALAWGLAQLEAGAEAAAYTVAGFPDNSAVFHAWRAGGHEPGVQPSGAALLVSVPAAIREEWRWAAVYNEDHHFIRGLRTVTGGPPVSQLPYDPWTPGRAASEEAGEILSEGLAMGSGTDAAFWSWQLRRRFDFLVHVRSLSLPDAAHRAVMEAMDVHGRCTGRMFAEWVRAWRAGSPSNTSSVPLQPAALRRNNE